MILFVLLLLLALLFLGGAFYAYRVAFYAPNKDREAIPIPEGERYEPYREEMLRIFGNLTERPCEEVTIVSFDGLQLSGRYYHVAEGAPLDIAFHGYRSSSLTDFCGGAELSLEMGHNLLLVDQRAHGRSQGRTITFGIRERQDLLDWVEYALKRFGVDVEILLFGISMGAATVLMAADLPLPENVKGIVADCPYASPLDIILHVGRNHPIPRWLMKPFVILGAKIFGGFDVRETDAFRALKQARVPVLILHGEADTFVPCEMSNLILCNPKLIKRFTFPGAGHGMSFLVDGARYKRLVREFVEAVL